MVFSKRSVKIFAIAFCATLVALTTVVGSEPASAASTTYYIDPAGSDGNIGTSAALPWKTLSKVDATTFGPGDSILFKAGGSWIGSLDANGSGSADQPIKVGMYGTGSLPSLNANLAAFSTVHLMNNQYWEIRDLDITNNDGSNPRTGTYAGVFVNAADMGTDNHIYLQRLTIHDVPGDHSKSDENGGITFQVTGTTTPTRFNDVLIDSNTITKTNWNGIKTTSTWQDRFGGTNYWFPSTNFQISNNIIDHAAGDAINPQVISNPIVENNYSQYARADAYGSAAGIWPWNDDNAVFRFNEVAYTQTIYDGQAFDADGRNNNTVYEYNYSHDNQGGAFQLSGRSPDFNNNPTIRYNISQNDQQTFLFVYGNSTKAHIYNNTVYVPSGTNQDFIIGDGGSTYPANTSISNNIYDNQGSGGGVPANLTGVNLSHNNFFGTASSALLALDANKITSDPKFSAPGSAGNQIDMRSASRASGYALQSPSPDIGAGTSTDFATDGRADFVGHLVPATPDIGAVQYASTTSAGLQNGDFEIGNLNGWTAYNATLSNNGRSGTHEAKLTGPSSDLEQVVAGLTPSTSYTFTGYVAVENAGDTARCGVKSYGGTEIYATVGTTQYSPCAVTFTTGPSDTSATIYFWKPTTGSGSGPAYGDDFHVSLSPSIVDPIANAGFEDGALNFWVATNASISTSAHLGSYAAQLNGAGGDLEQTIYGLHPVTSYTFTAYLRVGTAGDDVRCGAKNFGGSEVYTSISSTAYAICSVSFTTGTSGNSAILYIWKPTTGSGSGPAWADDLTLN